MEYVGIVSKAKRAEQRLFNMNHSTLFVHV